MFIFFTKKRKKHFFQNMSKQWKCCLRFIYFSTKKFPFFISPKMFLFFFIFRFSFFHFQKSQIKTLIMTMLIHIWLPNGRLSWYITRYEMSQCATLYRVPTWYDHDNVDTMSYPTADWVGTSLGTRCPGARLCTECPLGTIVRSWQWWYV